MKTIKFFSNHNQKLGCDFFTTIRPEWSYYSKGEIYGIVFNKQIDFTAQIIDIKKFYLKDINQWISFLDASKSPEQFRVQMKIMYPKKDFEKERLLLLLLKKIK